MTPWPSILLARIKAGLLIARGEPVRKPMGIRVVFGIPKHINPIHGIPDGGRLRLRLRPGKPAKAYWHTNDGVEEYYVEIDSDGAWIAHRSAANITTRQ